MALHSFRADHSFVTDRLAANLLPFTRWTLAAALYRAGYLLEFKALSERDCAVDPTAGTSGNPTADADDARLAADALVLKRTTGKI